MARLTYRFQAIRQEDAHSLALKALFDSDDIERAYIGVAYARESGVKLLHGVLSALRRRVRVFVGIRNDTTSAQALLALRRIGVDLYVVDTGRATEIFHPKVYAAIQDDSAIVITGSPNLTAGGLEGNIEASTALHLDLTEDGDREYLEDLEKVFESLPTTYPKNVIRITRTQQVTRLLQEGRVADETIRRLPTTIATGAGMGGAVREMVPRMLLARRDRVPRPKPHPRATSARTLEGFALVWESDDLSERDLNIPSGANTNPTGSMTLRKGRTPRIDQRHYFRDELFNALTWTPDQNPAKAHLETATGRFNVVIKGVSYGQRDLVVRHDTRTNSASYRQKNAMTHLRWGDLRPLIARRDLLGSQLRIYRKRGAPPAFALELL